MTKHEAAMILDEIKIMDDNLTQYIHGFDEALNMAIEALQKYVTQDQLEEMFKKYREYLWRESDDVRGDDMIEIGYAEEYLAERLREFGCWCKEEESEDKK